MNEKEKCLYNFYGEYFDDHGMIPTMVECMEVLHLKGWATFYEIFHGLQSKGFIEHTPYKKRNVKLLR